MESGKFLIHCIKRKKLLKKYITIYLKQHKYYLTDNIFKNRYYFYEFWK